jgi:UDP-N-acetyl-D-glucosamine dehydrogenase
MHGFLDAGFSVIGYDRSPLAVATCRHNTLEVFKGKKWSVGTDPVVLLDSDVIVVAVRILISRGYIPNFEPLQSVAKLLLNMSLDGRLILIASTLPGGSTRRLTREWLGLDESSLTFVAHIPERLSEGQDWQELRTLPHLVGGLDPISTDIASEVMGTIVERIVPVSAPEVSELSKLLENAFLTVNISLVSEITKVAHCLGVTGTEVCSAAATKPSGYLPFFPGPGIGGHCLKNDLLILHNTFQAMGEDAPILDAVATEVDAMPILVINRLTELLLGRLKEMDILLVGVGFKPWSSDTSATPAGPLVRLLRIAGANPIFVDGGVNYFDVDGQPVEKIDASELHHKRFPIAVILSGDPGLDPGILTSTAKQVLDASGGRAPGADQIPCDSL